MAYCTWNVDGPVIFFYTIVTNLIFVAEYLDKWKSDGKSGIFIKIPLKHSWSASYLGSLGFTCHHAKNDYIMMTKWLQEDKENKIPLYAFHTVGVSGYYILK